MTFKAKIDTVTFALYFLRKNSFLLLISILLTFESVISLWYLLLIFILTVIITLFNAFHVEYIVESEYIALRKGIFFESRIYFQDIVEIKDYQQNKKQLKQMNNSKGYKMKIFSTKYLYKEQGALLININEYFYVINSNNNNSLLKEIYYRNPRLRKELNHHDEI